MTATTVPKTAAAPNDAIRQIIVDSNELLQKSAELAPLAAKVPALEQKVAELSTQKTAAEKELTDLRSGIAAKVADFADKLVRHGSLNESKKATFVSTVNEDPTQIIDVMEKLSALASPNQFGAGDLDKTGSDVKGPDPIEAFCGVG